MNAKEEVLARAMPENQFVYLNRCAAAVEWVEMHKAEVWPATVAFPSWAVLLPAAVTYTAHGVSWLAAVEAAMKETP